MADEHALGIDVRFAIQSSTVIVVPRNKDLPTRYMFLQMAGRSQRDTDYPTCTIFTANGKGQETFVTSQLDTVEDNPLCDWDHAWKTVTGERKKEIGKAVLKKQSRENSYQLRLCVDSITFDNQIEMVTGKKN